MAPRKVILFKTVIIDGHNLVPKVAGLSLEDPDDEERLIERLKAFAVRRRKHIEVFFDKAAPGQAGVRQYGPVRAHFVPAATIADEAIRRYVTGLGRQAKNVTVVSSDHRVQAEVRPLGAQVMESEWFAAEMAAAAEEQLNAGEPPSTQVDEWLDVFGFDPLQAEQPIDLGKKPKKKDMEKKNTAVEKKRPHHGYKPKP